MMHRIKNGMYRRAAHPQVVKTFELERAIAERVDVIHANEESPLRFELLGNMSDGRQPPFVLRAAPHMAGSVSGIRQSLSSIRENPDKPRTTTNKDFLDSLEGFAKRLGATSIGYAKVPRKLIFQDKAILHDNAIVLTMEMDWERMEPAPHPKTVVMVHETYNKLGRLSNKIAGFLRKHGYSAHAGHPLLGLVLYPPLARLAGLGWQGLHGLIITPEHGPRVRLAAVFTSIENLPLADRNPHAWVEGYCARCQHCIRECPVDAIFEEPIVHGTGQLTYTSTERCFPYFMENYGCSVCIKVCPFNRMGYEKVQRVFIGESAGVDHPRGLIS